MILLAFEMTQHKSQVLLSGKATGSLVNVRSSPLQPPTKNDFKGCSVTRSYHRRTHAQSVANRCTQLLLLPASTPHDPLRIATTVCQL